MGKSKKLSASEIDGVNYHRARWWQIALGQTNGLISSAFGVMIGVISYLANSGYGVVVSVVGIILTVSRVFDGLIDPVIALIIDKMDTRFGKIRIMMTIGFLIRTFAVFMLFVWGSGKFGIVFFIVMYLVYILGNSIGDIAANMIGPALSNDPKQRPAVFYWGIAFNAFGAIFFNLIVTLAILPVFGNQYTNEMLAMTCIVYVIVALFFHILCCIGITGIDRPETFESMTEEKVEFRDMWDFLKNNRPFQMYVIDYELDRSGKYLSAVVTSTYNFIDQIVSSLGMLITTSLLALIGYTHTMPQPTDDPTAPLKAVGIIIIYVLPILGWICTIVAMKFYTLGKEEMVHVQKRIETKKKQLLEHAAQ